MLNQLYQVTEERMKKCVTTLQGELTKLRTGRAHTSLLDHIRVSYYGSEVPLNQVANISVADARTFTITPFDKAATQAIEKAIMTSDLGLNPTTAGTLIRVPLPALTQERRAELVKIVKGAAEDSRVAIRNVRRDILTQVKSLLKTKELSEDDERVAETKVQQFTDKYVEEIEKIIAAKEQELMAV